ncbi:MAG: tetratricopeptide repeat protein [Verrucomicrobia bacterium]|nr:tetratricopeptide repeat protein [Verrucomicrobiota bacterium]
MKKCPVCGNGKARRRCARHGDVEVCSQCCAAIRDADCGDCIHHAAARQHQATRSNRAVRSGVLPEGKFLIEINPAAEEAVDGALALAERGETKQAREILTRLQREYPRNHHVCFGMGILHVTQKELPQAIEWFDQAIAIFPYMIEAHFNKAVVYKDLMDIPNCVRAFRKVVELGARGDSEVNTAQSFLDGITASLRAQEGISLDTFLASSEVFQQAFDCMQRNEWQQALDGFLKVIAMNDRNVASHGNLGLCYAQLGYQAKALAELDRALELDPWYKPARINRKAAMTMTEGRPLDPKTVNLVEFNRGEQVRDDD